MFIPNSDPDPDTDCQRFSNLNPDPDLFNPGSSVGFEAMKCFQYIASLHFIPQKLDIKAARKLLITGLTNLQEGTHAN